MSYPISDHADKLILAETVFYFYALTCAGAYYKVWVIPSQTMQKNWYWLRRSSISMHELVPEPTKRYQLSHLRACRQIDISWDGPQFLCTSLCRCLLKDITSSCPISDHAEKLILAETVFNFYALACAGACCNIVFGCCLDSLVNTKSPFPLQITSVWTFVCKGVLVHSAYWSPRSKCVRRIWELILRVVIVREVFQQRRLRAIAPPLTTIFDLCAHPLYMS
jgi:hypothetical protein